MREREREREKLKKKDRETEMNILESKIFDEIFDYMFKVGKRK